MKYNRSEIMKTAWHKHNRFGMDMSTALRIAWMEAKNALPVHQVWGFQIWNDSTELIAGGLTYEKALEVRYDNKCRYDRVEIKAA